MSALNDVTDADWSQQVTERHGWVLVDCWAAWCAPCTAMLPSFTELAGDYRGEVTFAKLDVEQNPQTALALKVRGIPLLVLFRDGREIGRSHGGSKSAIAAFIDNHLG